MTDYADLEKRLRVRQRDCERQALDFRDIGGRNADDKAAQYEAAATDFREAADALASLRELLAWIAALPAHTEEDYIDSFAAVRLRLNEGKNPV